MTQTALPASDVFDGGWTPQPIYAELRKNAPNDSTFVSSSSEPAGDYFEVKLDPLAWPQIGQGAGPETLTVRLRRTAADAAYASVLLMQGDRAIAGRNFRPTADFADCTITLTPGQIALITDYSDLRVRVAAGGPTTSCCLEAPPPALIQATFTGTLAWLGTVALVWDGTAYWRNYVPQSCDPDAGLMQILFECSGPGPGGQANWILYNNQVANGYFSANAAGPCDPFSVAFAFNVVNTGVEPDGPCIGAAGATVTT